MAMSLSGKRILVTGAGQGIGNELCKTLDKLGAKVIAVSRSLKPLEELKAEAPNIQIISVDLTDWNNTRKVLLNADVGKLDGLVNNAGIAIIKPFIELTEQDFDDTFNANIKSIFNLTQFLLPNLNDGSCIVNVSSLASRIGIHGHAAYSATKAALDSFTKSLTLELAPRKIRVNSVNPTVILTRMGRENWSDPAISEPILSKIPLHRFGEVNEVVEPIIFLLSDSSSFINGHSLPLEGGYLAN